MTSMKRDVAAVGQRRVCSALAICLAMLTSQSATAQTAFQNVTAATGLYDYRASSGDLHGAAGIFADLNNDRFPDLYLIRDNQPNQLFVNVPAEDGRSFTELANAGGAGNVGRGIGAIAGDYDNDGDRDVFVVNFSRDPGSVAENALYQNQLSETGDLRFLDVTANTDPTPTVVDNQYGLRRAVWNTQVLDNNLAAAWGDPDRDGDLDLYIGNHDAIIFDRGEHGLAGQRDIFYMNNGDGTFTDATDDYRLFGFETASGDTATDKHEFSSSNAVAWADFNNDGWQDLLVTNKVGGPHDRDILYLNQGTNAEGNWNGMKVANYKLPSAFGDRSTAAMGVDVGDIDNDGDLDIYLTDWSNLNNTPRVGSNDIWFNQLAETGELDFEYSGKLPALFSWGTQIADYNNDGFQDIYVATHRDASDFFYEHQGEQAIVNGTDMYVDRSEQAGVDQTQNTRTAMSADYNRDGRLDLFVVNLGEQPSALFENGTEDDHHFLSLELTGAPDHPNGRWATSMDAINSRAFVTADLDGDGDLEPHETQIREVTSGSSNAATTSSLALEFGLGLAETADVRIQWASGRITEITTATNQFLKLEEPHAAPGDCFVDEVLDANDLECVSTIADRDLVLAALNSVAGDLNGDGEVGFADFIRLSTEFGSPTGSYSAGNINVTGGIDFADFLALANNFGKSGGVAAVPEPAVHSLWIFVVVVGWARRKRSSFR